MLLVVSGIACALLVPPDAAAMYPPCKKPWVWSNDSGDTWRFESCNGMVVVIRDGGPLGYCSRKYPDGSVYTGPDSDCAYHGPH